MHYRLVALDADGTLLRDNDELSPSVRAAVHATVGAGVEVVVATGRAFDGAGLVLDHLGLDLGLILCNGAIATEGRDLPPFRHCMLDVEVARETVRVLTRHGIRPYIYDDPLRSETIAIGVGDAMMPSFLDYRTDVHRHGDLLEWLDHDPMVVVFAGTEAELRPVADELRAHLSPRAAVFGAPYPNDDLWIVTLINPDNSKGAALRDYAARRGISLSEVLAVGDAANDVEMLTVAGFGVAMGNADPQVQAVADAVVADNRRDGVAEALRRWVLA